MEVVEILGNWTISQIYLPNIYLLISETHSQGRIYKEKEVVGRRNAGNKDHCWAPSISQSCSRGSAYVMTTSTPHKNPRKCLLHFPSVLWFHSPFLPTRTMTFNIFKYMDTSLGGKHMTINVWRVCIFLFSLSTYFWDLIRHWTLFKAEGIKRWTE